MNPADFLLETQPTADGSLTCRDPHTGELYHNRAGAYTEALKNYVQPLNPRDILAKTGELRVLDACYGLGYNTWVLIADLLQGEIPRGVISVIALDSDEKIFAMTPLMLSAPSFDILKLKIDAFEHNIDYRTLSIPSVFTTVVEDRLEISVQFLPGDLRQELPKLEHSFDVVFHDPFSPAKLTELWTVDIFRQYYRLLSPSNGMVLTYSAASAVRGGLQEAGFTVWKTQVVGDKAGGTAGLVDASPVPKETLAPLDPEEIDLLATRSGIPYRDPSLNLSRQEVIENRKLEQAASNRPFGSVVRNRLEKRLGVIENTTIVE